MSVKNHHLPTSPFPYSSDDGEWWSRFLTRSRLSVCRITKKLSIIEVLSRALPHKSLHLQHIITKESPNILFYTTAGKRDHKTHHGVIWLTNCSSMFGLRVIFNSTFVCSEQCDTGRRQGTKVKHLTIFLTNIIRRQTYKSPMLEDSSGPATAHVRQKPTESFERWGELGRPCSDQIWFSSFCFRWSNLSLLELSKVISLGKMLF